MKAIRIHFAEDGDELRMEEVPQPEPKAGEVLIKTQAIGVNRADLGRRRTASEGQQEPPRIPGLDVAGVVESVGADVTNWRPGDQVMALVRSAYAEYSIASSVLTYRPPEGMSTTDAASLPCVFFTAWYAFQMAELKPGETALIHAAGSGVGNHQANAFLGAFPLVFYRALHGHILGLEQHRQHLLLIVHFRLNKVDLASVQSGFGNQVLLEQLLLAFKF